MSNQKWESFVISSLGIGPGLSSKLQLGVGFGAGCGVGIGFGYGMGKGVAQDDSGRHANLGRLSRQNGKLPFRCKGHRGLEFDCDAADFCEAGS
ncbi:hypothetical protein C5167_028279 [Papaver somniferum]|nr:hypothetical protein C5167_028279 [Papaver somniferum]